MTGFSFDPSPSPGTNRAAAPNGCPTCHGDRLVLVEENNGHEVYGRCPDCCPSPVTERPPVEADAWWKE